MFIFTVILCSPFYSSEASAKVLWGGMELRKGQIGKVTIIQPTELYEMQANTKKVVRKLKKGEVYRVYSFSKERLYLGNKRYVNLDHRVKYEEAPREKRQALGVNIVKKTYGNAIDYPQVTGLISKTAENKINAVILKHVRASYQNYLWIKEDEELGFMFNMHYEVKYNENNLLSVLITDYEYTGGAHGNHVVESYNFNVLTGERLYLPDVAKSQSALNKIKNYVIADLTKRAKAGESFFVEWFPDIKMDKERLFYFTPNGIVIKFGLYEIAPYVSGTPEVKVPYSVFR